MRIGFDNEKYLKMQSEHIRNRIGKFGNKLYLEFGGKLFDDYHASRVLPGFAPDSKLRLLKELSSQAEIVIVISAKDIEKNKIRGDLGITYDTDVLRLIQTYKDQGLYVGSVTITQFSGQESALLFKNRLEKLHIPVYLHYLIPGYPSNIPLIISDEGYGKNDYIKTSRPLVIVTAPGPGSGKMAACLSQLYHEHKRGVLAGYAKFETFPIWNLPLKHPVNLAYEAATADLNDINMIDPFHLSIFEKEDVDDRIGDIICRSLRFKKSIVEQDETEQGMRKALNFGHTIGHGIEAVKGIKGRRTTGLFHGECVALGMLPMIESKALQKRVRNVYRRLGLPTRTAYDKEKVLAEMLHDKKAQDGQITIIKVPGLGCWRAETIPVEGLRPLLGMED